MSHKATCPPRWYHSGHKITQLYNNEIDAENRETQTSLVKRLIEYIHPSWIIPLEGEFKKPYFMQIVETLKKERAKFIIYPPENLIFSWSHFTPFESVRVVILGQDPYHGKDLATGLAFSTPRNMSRIQPSLINIFKEIQASIEEELTFPHGCLEHWAFQGVLLLNSILTVRANSPSSHADIGWEIFTDKIIEILSQQQDKKLVFVFWGAYARRKADLIKNPGSHLILNSVHPLSFTAHKDFLGNGHFKAINEFLVLQGQPAIDWSVV